MNKIVINTMQKDQAKETKRATLPSAVKIYRVVRIGGLLEEEDNGDYMGHCSNGI